MNFKISIVSPVFNEEEVLRDFYNELHKSVKDFDYEIIFIDDGSSDNSFEVLKILREKDRRVKIICLKKNYGQQAAILVGLGFAEGDLAIVLDADLQDNPAYISDLIKKWQSGAKIVFTRRAKRNDCFFKKATAFLFYRLLKIINPKIALDSGDFYLLDKIVVKKLTENPPKHLFLRGIISQLPFKKDEIIIERGKRQKGKSGYSLKKMLHLAWDAVMLSLCHSHSQMSPSSSLVIPAKAGIQKIRNKYFLLIQQARGIFKNKSVCIIGGGISGLAIGYYLSNLGFKITVLEKSKELGGLLKTFKTLGGTDIEKYYHHIFKTDKELLALIGELNLGDKLKWHPVTTSLHQNKKFYSFTKPTDLVISPLTFKMSMRMGIATMLLNKLKARRFADITAKKLILKYMGKTVWANLWRPLFEGKFGEYASEIGAPWFISRLKSRIGTREKGREVLGYMDGSFSVLVDTLSQKIKENGGEILLNQDVEKIDHTTSRVIPELRHGMGNIRNPEIYTKKNNDWIPAFAGMTKKETLGRNDKIRFIINNNEYDYIISTVAPETVVDIAPLNNTEKKKLNSVKYTGAICSVIELKSKLTDYYWNNILDKDIPFKGIIEHTNLISTEIYSENHIVYLSHYTKNDSEYFRMNEEELKEAYLKNLEKMFPEIRGNILSFKIFRARNAQPIIPPNYDPPPNETSIPNFFMTSMAHIYPEDRGMNQAIKEAEKIRDLLLLS